jgi:coenzyme F420-reducing hydrogenase alpha subunit
MALDIKRIGNDIMEKVGGREIHPVSPRVGGFSRAARKRELEPLPGIADFVASLPSPSLPREVELVSMVHPTEYPINEGSMASTTGRRWGFSEYESVTQELHVEHSNALHSVMTDTQTPYHTGPLARVNLNADLLTPVAKECMARAGLSVPEGDPFFSMAARVAEAALAVEESIRIIPDYVPPEPPMAEVVPKAGRGMWATEAPRGTLYHRYDADEDGTILAAKIVPPTSQNLRHMEEDLRAFVPGVLDRPDEELTRLCEMVVRNYDPCISCATHFLSLDIQRV